jgi:hypothetical protein
MLMEPINIFSHRIDPRGVLSVLRSLAPDVVVTGPDDAWQEATVTIARPGRKEPIRLTVRAGTVTALLRLRQKCPLPRTTPLRALYP